jgi:endonuclease-3
MKLISLAKTRKVLDILAQTYPDAKCALNFRTPFELLIATMLSAQSTDVRVNMVTDRLFKKYHHPEDYASITPDILEVDIKELGLFRSKAEHIVAMSRILLEEYGGTVPRTREELVKLPGVGKKTANVVLSNAFDVPAIAVDTHVLRVSNRIGLADSSTPDGTEQMLCKRMPKYLWSSAHHWLIHHGRNICSARKPKCEICPVQFCEEVADNAHKRRIVPSGGSSHRSGDIR